MIVLWRITERCNLSCAFCAYDRRLLRPPGEADPLAIRQFGLVLSSYQRDTGDRILVSWIGGEPFLFAPLTELTIEFKEKFGLAISTTTNGTALCLDRVREHVVDYYDELTVSIDGVGVVHDNLRGWAGGYLSLHKSIVQIGELIRRRGTGPRLRINVVLQRQTIRDFPALCLELVKWGIDEITFNQLGGLDRPEYFPEHRLSCEDVDWLASILPNLRDQLETNGIKLNGSAGYLDRIRASSNDVKIPITNCMPGERLLFISENSMVAPCHFTTPTVGIPISDLASVKAILELPRRFRGLLTHHRPTACQDCHSTRVFSKFAA